VKGGLSATGTDTDSAQVHLVSRIAAANDDAPLHIFCSATSFAHRSLPPTGEHEASRRMKTELLLQLDGLARRSDELVFVLAATNLPWELDQAMLRRLEKRILVPLPTRAGRRAMLSSLLAGRCCGLTQPATRSSLAAATGTGMGITANGTQGEWAVVDLDALAAATEGFSGSDIAVLAKEAAMRPLRRLMRVLEPAVFGDDVDADGTRGGATAAAPMQSAAATLMQQSTAKADPTAGGKAAGGALNSHGHNPRLLVGPVTAADAAAALAATKPTARLFEAEYSAFTDRFGQVV